MVKQIVAHAQRIELSAASKTMTSVVYLESGIAGQGRRGLWDSGNP